MAKRKNKKTPFRDEIEDIDLEKTDDAENNSNLNIDDDLNVDDDLETGTDTKKTNTDDVFDDSATFLADKTLGVGASAIQPKAVDTSATDEYLAEIEKPASTSVYDKMAARYRSQGEGAVLRTQKNLTNLFAPTITLIKEREAAASARFTLLKEKMPEFDESTIFGDQSNNPMPIVDEIKNISSTTKDDLRALSRLNPNDDRYDEIRKRVEKNQDVIVKFDQINKKLLEIRNAGTDESQWSAGMDETTANMWRDIYTSNGQNIKIQDGKLVWTDTKGTTSYEFPEVEPGTGEMINGEWDYLVKPKTLGGVVEGEHRGGYKKFDIEKSNPLGILSYYSEHAIPTEKNAAEWSKSTSPERIKELQSALIKGGFTDADGNELDPDGEWGTKSQAAYDKYLAQKDKLETAWLDKNYEGDLRTTTGVGETKTIDLSAIGDGPTMIDNEATNLDRVIKGEVQKFIEMDGTINDPMYNQMIKAKLFELNKLGPQGIKSLIFDGMNTDDDDLFTGSNTNSFLEGVVRSHYGEKLNEQEIAEKIDLMRSGDVTQQYKDENGELKTLRSQYMKWYKGEIDGMIDEGKKSKVVSSATGNTNTSNRSNRSTSGGGGNIQSGQLMNTLQTSGAAFTYGTKGKGSFAAIDKTDNGGNLEVGEIYLKGTDLDKIMKDYDMDQSWSDTDYKLTEDNILQRWNKDEQVWEESVVNQGTTVASYSKEYNTIIDFLNKQDQSLQIKSDVIEFDDYRSRATIITSQVGDKTEINWNSSAKQWEPNFNWISSKNDAGKYILDYDKQSRVLSRLKERYGKLGFVFTEVSGDKFKITLRGESESDWVISVVTDRWRETDGMGMTGRKTDEKEMIEWMQSAWNSVLSERLHQDFRVHKMDSGIYNPIAEEADAYNEHNY